MSMIEMAAYAELDRENDRLRARIAELETGIEGMHNSVKSLEFELNGTQAKLEAAFLALANAAPPRPAIVTSATDASPRCDHCGARTIDNCPNCGAPQCCPQCCQIQSLTDQLSAEQKEIQGDNELIKKHDAVCLRLVKERDEAQAACSEMRTILEVAQRNWVKGTIWTMDASALNHALSSDCGKSWHSPEQWEPVACMLNLLRRLTPIPPRQITYEMGVELLDTLQAELDKLGSDAWEAAKK